MLKIKYINIKLIMDFNLLKKMTVAGMVTALVGFSACSKAPHEISETALYESMLRVDEEHTLVFDEFPEALKPMEKLGQGDIFKTHFGDTLQLVCRFPNQADTVNRYPFYFMRDNHGHYWSMFHEADDKYHIFRHDSSWGKRAFRSWQKSLDEKEWTKNPIGTSGGISRYCLIYFFIYCISLRLITLFLTNRYFACIIILFILYSKYRYERIWLAIKIWVIC